MGPSTTSGPDKAGLRGVDTEVSAVLSILHARSSWAGSPVESQRSGRFRRAENAPFPRRWARFAHNDLVRGSSPSSPVRCEPMFPALWQIARNLRAFPQVQMRDVRLCRRLRSP